MSTKRKRKTGGESLHLDSLMCTEGSRVIAAILSTIHEQDEESAKQLIDVLAGCVANKIQRIYLGETISKAQAADVLDVSTGTVRNMLLDGRLKLSADGNAVDRQSVLDYMQAKSAEEAFKEEARQRAAMRRENRKAKQYV